MVSESDAEDQDACEVAARAESAVACCVVDMPGVNSQTKVSYVACAQEA